VIKVVLRKATRKSINCNREARLHRTNNKIQFTAFDKQINFICNWRNTHLDGNAFLKQLDIGIANIKLRNRYISVVKYNKNLTALYTETS